MCGDSDMRSQPYQRNHEEFFNATILSEQYSFLFRQALVWCVFGGGVMHYLLEMHV